MKVLLIGNSFARDFANVILESSLSNMVNIVYCMQSGSIADDPTDMLEDANIVFLAGVYRDKLPAKLKLFYDGDLDAGDGKTYYVGNKWFGNSMGVAYNRRFMKDYGEQTLLLPDDIVQSNAAAAKRYGRFFIDMLSFVKAGDGAVKIFSDDGMFLSQDCMHLTRPGAKFYAKKINWKSFGIQE